MERRQFLLASGTATAAALAGCIGRADEGDEPTNDPGDGLESLTDALDESGGSRTITVSASGETEAEPDLAILELGVTATGDDQGAVRDELATRGETLEEALLEFGLDDDAITTSRFDIGERRRLPPEHPEYSEDAPAYEGTHSFSVEVDDPDDVGALVDAAVDAGADDVGRIEFTLSEETRDELREEALQEALSLAREEGEVIADEIGATIVHAETVDASGGRVSPIRTSYEMSDGGDDAAVAVETAIREDDVTVSAGVTVTYGIE